MPKKTPTPKISRTGLVQLLLKLPASLDHALREHASRRGETLTAVVQRAVTELIEREAFDPSQLVPAPRVKA